MLPPDVAPNEDWDYYYRHQERMDLLLVGTFPNFTTAADLVPQELYALQLRCSAGDTGQVGMGELFDQWRTWLACIGSQGPGDTGQFCGAAILPEGGGPSNFGTCTTASGRIVLLR